MTRLTLSAADPMIVGIVYAAMHDLPRVQIMFTANKYVGTLEDVKKSRSVHIAVVTRLFSRHGQFRFEAVKDI